MINENSLLIKSVYLQEKGESLTDRREEREKTHKHCPLIRQGRYSEASTSQTPRMLTNPRNKDSTRHSFPIDNSHLPSVEH